MNNLLILLVLFYSNLSIACPGCAGSMDNAKDLTYIYVLGGFIALIYIPFYIIYRVIKKNKDANDPELDSLEANSNIIQEEPVE